MKIKNRLDRMNRRAELRRQFPEIKKWIDENLKVLLINRSVVGLNENGEGRTIGVELKTVRNKKEYKILLKIDLMIYEKSLVEKNKLNYGQSGA